MRHLLVKHHYADDAVELVLHVGLIPRQVTQDGFVGHLTGALAEKVWSLQRLGGLRADFIEQVQFIDDVVDVHIQRLRKLVRPPAPLSLETAVGRAGVPVFLGSRQDAARRNGYSITTSCNAAMDPKNQAIRLVADSPNGQMGK